MLSTAAQSRSTRTSGWLQVAQQAAGVVGDPVRQPSEVVDDPHQRPTARGERDGPEVGAEEAFPQSVHRTGASLADPVPSNASASRVHTCAAS